MVLAAKPKAPNTLHHKKRSGTHHRQSKDYQKHYWPYLPLIAIAAVGLVLNGMWARQPNQVLGDSTDVSALNLLVDTNMQREGDHESDLQLSDRLSNAAQTKADDMVTRNYWSHDTPDGKTPWTFITAAGYSYVAAGENLAYGFSSSEAILSSWIHSPEHRANILNNHFSQVGFGLASSPNYQGQGSQTVIVAMYAEPVATLTSAQLHKAINSPASITSPSAGQSQPASQRIARIQVLSPDSDTWSVLTISVLGAIALVWFVLRHLRGWKRVLVHGEDYIIHHPLFDILVICVAILGYLLTRPAGFIH